MNWKKIAVIMLGMVLFITFNIVAAGGVDIRGELPEWENDYLPSEVETAVLAGGCFWGVESVYEQLNGVLDVVSGYSGGDKDTATYRLVGTGRTGHAESVEIIYDPTLISFETLLDVFFKVAHDPTQLNYQGPDRGTEYRSVVFYANEEQKKITQRVISDLSDQGIYSDEIVTEISPLEAFYPAEEYHQDFLRLNPSHGYIVYWDIPKLVDLFENYPGLIAEFE